MGNKVLSIVSKALFGVFIFFTVASLIVLMIKQDKERNKMYRIDFDGHRIWTEKVVRTEDGSIEFTDTESKRKFAVYGNYAIIEPKSK
jgi:hypothetical protein